jgi:acetyl-CoA carboxylase alpha subunit
MGGSYYGGITAEQYKTMLHQDLREKAEDFEKARNYCMSASQNVRQARRLVDKADRYCHQGRKGKRSISTGVDRRF